MDRPGGVHLGEFSANEFDFPRNRIESTNSYHPVIFSEGQTKADNHFQGLVEETGARCLVGSQVLGLTKD
jgi:hypothetical protein